MLTPVRYFTPDDPYHYSVDNRPLTDLDQNQQLIAKLVSQYANSGAPNRIINSGRFAGGSPGLYHLLSDSTNPFSNNSFFTPNAGFTATEAGKFIFNNSDFGGTQGAMTASTLALLATMGRTGGLARYGIEFRIAQITQGSGVSNPRTFQSGVSYLLSSNQYAMITGGGGYATFAAWVRPFSANLGVAATSLHEFYVNGTSVSTASDFELLPAQGWTHLRMVLKTPEGYDNSFPCLYLPHGGYVQMALPVLISGYTDLGLHTSPIPSEGTFG